MTPRAYSRLETDAELVARVTDVKGLLDVRNPYETIDAYAERHGLQRRIVWITPEAEVRR